MSPVQRPKFSSGNLLIVRSDPRDDLDPRLVHRLETRGLHLGILVWDRSKEHVPRIFFTLSPLRLTRLTGQSSD
jgi:hypothetical protein